MREALAQAEEVVLSVVVGGSVALPESVNCALALGLSVELMVCVALMVLGVAEVLEEVEALRHRLGEGMTLGLVLLVARQCGWG